MSRTITVVVIAKSKDKMKQSIIFNALDIPASSVLTNIIA
jgi:hypothetical protein